MLSSRWQVSLRYSHAFFSLAGSILSLGHSDVGASIRQYYLLDLLLFRQCYWGQALLFQQCQWGKNFMNTKLLGSGDRSVKHVWFSHINSLGMSFAPNRSDKALVWTHLPTITPFILSVQLCSIVLTRTLPGQLVREVTAKYGMIRYKTELLYFVI